MKEAIADIGVGRNTTTLRQLTKHRVKLIVLQSPAFGPVSPMSVGRLRGPIKTQISSREHLGKLLESL
jgi:hypothetical protein